MPQVYYWVTGLDMMGKPSIAGWFSTEDEAKLAQNEIVGIKQVHALPTKNMARAKSMLRYQTASSQGSLDAGVNQQIRGY
jgi:hypothetical protein